MTSDRRQEQRRKQSQPVAEDRRSADRRRGERRREARAPLDLWVEEERGVELYFRRTGNLSLGGISFEQAIPHAIGTVVRLRFSLPANENEGARGGSVVETRAVIVNTPQEKDGLGMGLRFVELPEAGAASIRRFLDGWTGA